MAWGAWWSERSKSSYGRGVKSTGLAPWHTYFSKESDCHVAENYSSICVIQSIKILRAFFTVT